MNATQEILDALYRLDVPRKNPRLERAIHDNTDDIRAILETHELVPVDQHAEMQRLLLPYAGLKLRDGEVMPVDGEGLVECLTRVLQAFEALRTGLRGKASCDCPWPATQSDGETLLRLLGVLG